MHLLLIASHYQHNSSYPGLAQLVQTQNFYLYIPILFNFRSKQIRKCLLKTDAFLNCSSNAWQCICTQTQKNNQSNNADIYIFLWKFIVCHFIFDIGMCSAVANVKQLDCLGAGTMCPHITKTMTHSASKINRFTHIQRQQTIVHPCNMVRLYNLLYHANSIYNSFPTRKLNARGWPLLFHLWPTRVVFYAHII